jgi:hypothetical protein
MRTKLWYSSAATHASGKAFRFCTGGQCRKFGASSFELRASSFELRASSFELDCSLVLPVASRLVLAKPNIHTEAGSVRPKPESQSQPYAPLETSRAHCWACQ